MPAICPTFTSSKPNLESQTDVKVAARLTRTAKVPHRIDKVVPRPTEQADVERAFVRLGESKYGPILKAPAREKVRPPPDVINLPGMAGETARAYYWHRKQPTGADTTPAGLASLLRLPQTGGVLAAVTQWYEELPEAIGKSPCDTLDRAYIEQRMGCWDSLTRCLFPGRRRANVSLMATTLSLETMLRLPADYRASGLFERDIVAYGWPELLVTGPNTGIGHTSALFVIESQMKYITECLRKLETSGKQSIEVRPEAEDAYTRMIHSEMNKTVWKTGGCKSWYQSKSGHVIAMFPGFSFTYRRLASRFRMDGHVLG